jgi:4-azaleucine resistance transporter AzlC
MQNHDSAAKRVFLTALPVMAGYVVLGIPCGILGAQAGMSAVQMALMSLLLYSGAGQYMIANMWLAGSPMASIVLSVSLINSRQTLYAAALARFCRRAGWRLTTLFAATVTDESFGVNLARFTSSDPWSVREATLVNLFAQGSWVLANVAGAALGAVLPVPTALASFAMTSIFICLLCIQRFDRSVRAAVLAATAGVCLCKLLGLTGPAILIGALLGVAASLLARDREGEAT